MSANALSVFLGAGMRFPVNVEEVAVRLPQRGGRRPSVKPCAIARHPNSGAGAGAYLLIPLPLKLSD